MDTDSSFGVSILRRAPAGWGTLAAVGGILLADRAGLGGWPDASAAFAAAALLAASAVAAARRGREPLAWALALGAVAALGAGRLGIAHGPLREGDVGTLDLPRKHAVVEGLVSGEPRRFPDRGTVVIDLEARGIGLKGEPLVAAHGAVRATLHWPVADLRYGDVVRLEGTLLLPPPPSNPGQRDAATALTRRGVRALLSCWDPGGLETVSRGRGSRVLAALLSLRRTAQARLAALVGPPESDLLGSIVFGLEAGFDPEVLESFRITGLMHVLVASGLNVGLLAWLCLTLLRAARVPRARASLLTLPVLVAYLLLCGAEPPLLRATLMFGLLVAAGALGRPASPFNALGVAAAGILSVSPDAVWDTSVQFSFASTAGVMALVPTLVGRLSGSGPAPAPAGAPGDTPPRGLRLPRWLVEAGGCTLAAQVALLPFLSSTFGMVPCLGAAANLLVTPTMGVFLTGGLALLLFGWVPFAGPGLGWLLGRALSLTLGIVEAFSRVPLASVVCPPMGPAALAAWSAWIAGGLLWISAAREPRDAAALPAPAWPRRLALAGLAVLVALVWRAALRPAPGDLTLTALDVGQGAACVIRLPSGRAVLVDAGPPFAGSSVVVPYLAHEGIGRLAAVFLSHRHDDHVGGMDCVLRRLRADLWIAPGREYPGEGRAAAAADGTARERRIPARPGCAGLRLEGDGVTIEVLNPPASGEVRAARDKRADENSLVISVRFRDAGALLCGDIEGRGEARLSPVVRRGPPADLLFLAHHGSDRGSGREFLAAARPRHAVAFAGAGNRFGFPHPATVIRLRDRGVGLSITGRDGAVRARTDGQGWLLGMAVR